MADDEALFLNGLKSILEQEEQLNILFTASDGQSFLEQLKVAEQFPDVMILDLRMKGMDGIETTQQVKEFFPEAKIMILSSHYRDTFLGYMLKLGVNAFLPKNSAPDQLIKAIEKVHEKGLYFDEGQMMSIHHELSSGKKPKVPQMEQSTELTRREVEILQLICEQYTNPEIANKLFISVRTVDGHRTNLLQKTGAKNTAGLVLYALYHQMIDWEERLLKFGISSKED